MTLKKILENFQLNIKPENPVSFIKDSVDVLSKSDVDCMMMACNTAHYFYNDIKRYTNIPILNIVDAVLSKLKELNATNVTLLASEGTVCSEIYEEKLNKSGFKINYPTYEEQKLISHLIYKCIKNNNYNNLYKKKKSIENMHNRFTKKDTDFIILACTELPIIYDVLNINKSNIIDSVQELALSAIKYR